LLPAHRRGLFAASRVCRVDSKARGPGGGDDEARAVDGADGTGRADATGAVADGADDARVADAGSVDKFGPGNARPPRGRPEDGDGSGSGPDGDFDRRWEELSRELGEELPPDLQSWTGPAAGPTTDPGGRRVVWGADPAELRAAAAEPPGPRDWSPPEEDDHFIPPDPPPLLGGNPIVAVGWIALLGGIAAVLAWAILGPRIVPVLWARGGLVLFLVGAGLLISRLPRRRSPEGDDPYWTDEDAG
jgi:hypothetical protein